jgi:hypothetical protein
MSEDIHRKIVAFLAAQFGRTEGRQCVRLDLVAANAGSLGTQLGTWDRAEDPALFAELGKIEELTTAIIARSQDHADSFGSGQHRFEVRTVQHLGNRLAHSFRLAAGGDMDGLSGGDDPPNATGVLAQQMRHTEIYMRTSMMMTQTTIGTLERQNRSLNEECAQLREERRAHLAELEQSRSAKDEREYAMSMGMAADERKTQAVGKILQLLPVVATKFLGKEAMGGKETPLSILISELGKSLTSEQIIQIRSTLSMEQQMLLMEAMQVAQSAEAAKDADKDASAGVGNTSKDTKSAAKAG